MAQSCRLCRKADDGFFESLFEYKDGQQIAEVVQKICEIEVSKEDKFPKNICEECLEISLSAFQLQKISQESDKYFRAQIFSVVVKEEPTEFCKVEEQENDGDIFHLGGEESYESFPSQKTGLMQDRSSRNFFDLGIENVKVEFNSGSEAESTSEIAKSPRKKEKKTKFHPRIVPGSVLKPCSEIWYSCNFCDKQLKPRPNMIRHMNLLHDPLTKPYACKYCILRFDKKKKRDFHQSLHSDDEAIEVIVCDICGATGNKVEGMQHHKRYDHSSDQRQTRSRIESSEEEIRNDESFSNDSSESDERVLKRVVKPRIKSFFHPRITPGSILKPVTEVWYDCNFCEKKLKPRNNMLRHMTAFHDPISKPFGCQYCILRFDSERKKDLHETSFHENEEPSIYFCDVCGASGSLEEGMKFHMQDDHKNLSSDLKNIKPRPSTKRKFKPDENSNDSEIVSRKSEKVIRRKSSTVFHPRITPGSVLKPCSEIWYSCNFCDKSLKPRPNMLRHMMKFHDPKSKPFACKFCVMRFDNAGKKEYHESAAHDDDEKLPPVLSCGVCGATGNHEIGMKHHKKDDHNPKLQEIARFKPSTKIRSSEEEDNSTDSEIEPRRSDKIVRKSEKTIFHPRITPGSVLKPCSEIWYSCNFCDKSLKPRPNMLRHMMLLHDPRTKPFACKFCVMRFDTDIKKEYHESTAHEDDIELNPVLVCDICGATGNHEKGMRQHKKDDHNPKIQKIVRLKTSNGMKASDESSNEEEERDGNVSSSERFNPRQLPGSASSKLDDVVFSCNFCDQRMKQRANILNHMKVHDPVEFPFACRYCISRFKTADEWNDHENKQHDGNSEVKTIVCDICGATGDNLEGMENHKMDDHRRESMIASNAIFNPRPAQGIARLELSEVLFECNFCEKVLKPKNYLVQHMRAKHDPSIKPFGCEYCVLRFRIKSDLLDHEAEAHEKSEQKSIYFCDICGVSGNKKDGMENHMTDDHLKITQKVEDEYIYNCPRCKAKFNRKSFLDHHLMFHHEENYKCSRCSETFSDKKRRINHVLLVHDKLITELEPHEVIQELKCCGCTKEFSTEAELTTHLASHRQGFVSIPCKLSCVIKLHTFDSFVAHSNYHSKAKTHRCLKCSKVFPLDRKLFAHVASHKRSEQPRSVKCGKCGSGFRTVKELDVHEKVKHQNQTLFICPFCAKSLASAAILDTHIRFVHNREREEKFECQVCNRKFMRNTCLIRHSATHRTERPHVCEQCGASFKTKEGIAIHLKRHDGTFLKKFDCNQCSHKFTSRHRLKVHLLTHSGIKPYECTYCDRAYTSKGDLTKHLQKVHVGDAVYQCEKCPLAFPKIVDLREHLVVHAQNN